MKIETQTCFVEGNDVARAVTVLFLHAPVPCTRQPLLRRGLRGVGVWRLVCFVQRLHLAEVV